MATPRDMDPKFSDENPAVKNDDVLTERDVRPEDDKLSKVNNDVPMIVYRQNVVDENGVQSTVEHGPMPVSEYEEYERKNNL